MPSTHLRFYALVDSPHAEWKIGTIRKSILERTGADVEVVAEHCFHVILKEGVDVEEFEASKLGKLLWLLAPSPFNGRLTRHSQLSGTIKEIGPRLTFKTAYCTNALSAFSAAGIHQVSRLERTIRYQFSGPIPDDEVLLEIAGDRMTECIYDEGIDFTPIKGREDFFEIDVLGDHNNLDKANKDLGLAFDDHDLLYYKDLFLNKLKRNPTDVELFDLAQSDSEHSRHWFFRGKLYVDGNERKETLMDSIRSTQQHSNSNNVIAFCDNSSAIRGFDTVPLLLPSNPTTSSRLQVQRQHRHITYSAETHNFPTAVCPLQGATTGTGGRIRDTHATGKGSHEIAGVVGYSFGNLHLPGYLMPWENSEDNYPYGFSHPRAIAIEASNGASDYGNKFGEPIVCGFARSFGQRLASGERSEYVKPIMFSGGIGAIDNEQVVKEKCREGMYLAKIGGPAYRVGVGGGAASSQSVQGSRESTLDFCAVQRGDAEMGQKLHRVVRACAEMGTSNPILAIHDQGAGGNGNVLKELVEDGGAIISAKSFELGDETISARELWTAEYQENDACLVDSTGLPQMMKISKREKCSVTVVGTVTNKKRVVLMDFVDDAGGEIPVDFDTKILGERQKKEFYLRNVPTDLKLLELPAGLTVRQGLEMVLRLPSVASKRYLTCKVDRSVTGLVAQQQCVGPLHTPLADVAVVALSYLDKVGGAVAVGEQPIKGLLSPGAGARMTLAETLTNLVSAPITDLRDVKMSGNWMWAAKCEGEGARLVAACDALCKALAEVGCAIDGGKDSLSMAAKVGDELVKAPGTLVLSAYAPCPDITKVITPNFKGPRAGSESTTIIYVRMGSSMKRNRLGGSALAQVLRQIGNDPADVEDMHSLAKTFAAIQKLVASDFILSAHDVSDGGFIVTLLEMAFAGNIEIRVGINHKADADSVTLLFAEEAGLFLEVENEHLATVVEKIKKSAEVLTIGKVLPIYGPDAKIEISVNGESAIKESLVSLREVWEETSDRLGLMQTDATCLQEAKQARCSTKTIAYTVPFEWNHTTAVPNSANHITGAPKVAIIREEGSNGDREMAAAFAMAGFQPYDVTMTDMLAGHTLDPYRVIAFVGGFSYADVLGSAKGWAAAIRFNPMIRLEFLKFRNRPDTLSFGVCNGCQLMAHLGWIGEHEGSTSVFLAENRCGRFESSFGPVRVEDSNSIWLHGMSGAVLGLWSSHGEGRFTYRTPEVLIRLRSSRQIAVRYVDSNGDPSMCYPWNPNGSEDAVAAISSENGRHLAMMPHSDRTFLSWQWPDYPRDWSTENCATPWLKMFQNAYAWIEENSPSMNGH